MLIADTMNIHFLDFAILGAFDISGLAGSLWSVLQVVLGLGFVIFVHELGHFLAAKYFGVKCEKFYIGFDVPIKIGPIRLPSNLGKFQWGETEYGIGIIPLGGYVRMLGQDDDPRNAQAEAARIRQAQDGSENNGEAQKPVLDPRSFPAKPVYARMIIISAGVIMNLIFAVIMGAIAFSIGVPYQATIVGGTVPGDPAWQNGVQVGDQVIQVGGMKRPNEKLHFRDMMENVAIAGIADEKKPIPLVLRRGSSDIELAIVGTKQHDPERFRTMLGVRAANSSTFAPGVIESTFRTDPKSKTSFGIQEGDKIVAVNGVALAIDERLGVPTNTEAIRYMDAAVDKPAVLKIERIKDEKTKATETLEVTVPPLPIRTVGLKFAIEGVTAIQKDSPAAKAGVQVGDQLVEFNGKAVEDGATLYLDVLKFCDKEVTLKLRKPDNAASESYELRWTVPAYPIIIDSNLNPAAVGFELSGSGLTYGMKRTISGVEPGSAAEKAGIQAGDVLAQFRFEPSEKLEEPTGDNMPFKKTPVDNLFSAHWMNDFLQHRPVDSVLEVFVEREGKMVNAKLAVAESDRYFQPGRGLLLEPKMMIEKATGLGNAVELGSRETLKRMGSVFTFLKLLGSGRVSRKAVGGPMRIVAEATNAASDGFTTLLMFLVLLSANLAIINFLPIPALDGGHMVFLTYEGIFGKPVDEELQAKLTMGGVLCLLALMVFVMFNDSINMFFRG